MLSMHASLYTHAITDGANTTTKHASSCIVLPVSKGVAIIGARLLRHCLDPSVLISRHLVYRFTLESVSDSG